MFKKILFSTVTLALTFFAGCDLSTGFSSQIKKKGEIVVAMDVDMPGYFVMGGESYGYQYDLLRAYADYLGVKIRIVNESSPQACSELMKKGEVDMFATLDSHLNSRLEEQAVSVYNTSYVILGQGKDQYKKFSPASDFSLSHALQGSKLMISSGFKNSANFNMLVDSLRLSGDMQLSSRNSFDLIRELGQGDYDLMICEKSEAQLGCAMVKGIRQVYEFSEKIGMSIVVNHKLKGMQANFEHWINSFRNGEEYALLNQMYFERGIVGQLIGDKKNTVVGGISIFDEIIKQVSKKEGHDWRFISAIAYSESRFNPHVVSRRGAKGLMQIMPSVARQFNVESKEIMHPETNVLLATKLLTKIERTLGFSKSTPYNDRIRIILACYNGGIGHVIDARNLAIKYGGNPNSWDDVSYYLRRKNDPEIFNDEVVKSGRFKGMGQTLAFVNKVMGKYNSYCDQIQL